MHSSAAKHMYSHITHTLLLLPITLILKTLIHCLATNQIDSHNTPAYTVLLPITCILITRIHCSVTNHIDSHNTHTLLCYQSH